MTEFNSVGAIISQVSDVRLWPGPRELFWPDTSLASRDLGHFPVIDVIVMAIVGVVVIRVIFVYFETFFFCKVVG